MTPTHRASTISQGPICDPEGGGKNPSTLHKQLISLLGCLGSSNVIIILTKALAGVRGISTTAADKIIKAPAFLCSKSCRGRLSRDRLWRETPRLGCFSRFLPFLFSSFQSCQKAPLAAGSRAETRMWLPSAYIRPEKPHEGQEHCTVEAAGCFPETLQGGIYLGGFLSLWQTAGRFRSLNLLAHPTGSHLLGEYSCSLRS